ncbi:Transcriptional regulator MerR family [Bacillus cereus]|nr:Transcriptional regulator MerR family [Bacillus cereus]
MNNKDKSIDEVTNYLDTPQSNIENIIQKTNLPLSEFPILFTTEEENYIKEAMQQFNT